MDNMIGEDLIVAYFFRFRFFIIACTGIANYRCLCLGQQVTCHICSFADEEGREQYEAELSEQGIAEFVKRLRNS